MALGTALVTALFSLALRSVGAFSGTSKGLSHNLCFIDTFIIGFPNGVCLVEDQACQIEDNLISLVADVTTLAQCRQICHDEPACAFATHFGANSLAFTSVCITFSSCPTVYDSQDSTTLDAGCSEVDVTTCSAAVVGSVGSNLGQVLLTVRSVQESSG